MTCSRTLFPLLFCFGLFALDSRVDPDQYVYKYWGARHGLPQLTVAEIIQTRDGYIWLATQEGLVRFDGLEFKVFDIYNTPQMTDQVVTALYEDRAGTIWVGFGDGALLSYNGAHFRKHLSAGDHGHRITSILEDRKGKLWIGSVNGLSLLEGGKLIISIPDIWVHELLESRNGDLWIATNGSGVIHKSNDLITVYDMTRGLSSNEIIALLEDNQGRLWLGTVNKGLMSMKNGRLTLYGKEQGLPHQGIRCLRLDRENNIWVGTAARGLVRFDDGEFATFSENHPLARATIFSLLEDNEGHLWAGTFSKGLFRIGDSRFKTLPQAQREVTWVIYQDPGGGLWFGMENSGLLRLDGERLENVSEIWGLPRKAIISSLVLDEQGQGWVSTINDGLYHYNGKTSEVFTFKEQLGSNEIPRIEAMLRDHEGSVWIAHEGLSRYSGDNWTHYHQTYLGAENFSALYQDRMDVLWVGSPRGPARIKNLAEPRPEFLECDFNGIIRVIFEDSQSSIWLSTSNSGLIRIRDGRCQAFRRADGLFSDSVFNILEDDRRNLWVSANQGIYRIPLDSFDRYLAGRTSRLEYQSFGLADGMPSAECNFSGVWSGARLLDGSIWFPTLAGPTFIKPDQLRLHEKAPVVLIDAFSNDNEDKRSRLSSVLPPGSADLTFHFTAFSWHDPAKVRFLYRLEGFDRDWVEAEDRRFARYSKLEPGPYQFHVKAANSDGIWNHEGASFNFRLEPYFYQTIWFTISTILLLVALTLGVHFWRMHRHRTHEEWLSQRVLESTNELTATNEELVRANRRLAENARQAGMAEIATEVLHNIGNIMNSANTSANMMVKVVQEDLNNRAVHYLAQLVAENEDNLGQWLDQDAKGRKVLPSLRQLAPILSESREALSEEYHIFVAQLEHIREIVSAQSSLGGTRIVEDSFPVVKTVEDVVKMQGPIIRGIQVDIQNLIDREVFLDASKSDFLQVMTNLIKNASEAIHGGPAGKDWKILIRLSLEDGMTACIQVIDGGCGMTLQTLEKLFEHGYTTKETGHGFGLHYCYKAVKQMGGRLEAESEGPGTGATMSIRVPVSFQKESSL